MFTSKKMLAALLLLLFFAGLNQSKAQNFEGIITYEMPGMQGVSGEMDYMIKGTKVRMNMGQGQQSAAVVYFTDKSEMVVIIDQMKAYMKTDMNTQLAGMQNEQDNSEPIDEWSESGMKQTGQSKTIAGHSCEVWQVDNENDTKYSLCMAEGLGSFVTPGNPMAKQSAPAWARKLMKDGFMPLEVIEIEGDNKSVQMRATKIEQKSLDDSLFEIPKAYRDMSGMMKQMRGNNRR